MDIQIDYFNITRQQIDKLLGASKAKEHIMKRSIFSVTIGSNDFLNNYLMPVLSIGARVSQTPEAFVNTLIDQLKSQLTVSYSIFLKTNTEIQMSPWWDLNV